MWPCPSSTGHGLGETAGPGQPDHVGDGFPGGQFRAELGDAAVEPELLLVRPAGGRGGASCLAIGRAGRPPSSAALVHDPDGQPGHQVGGLAGPLGQRLQAPLGVADEHLRVRPEPDPGPGHLLGHPADLGQALALLEGRRRARARRTPRARRGGSWRPTRGPRAPRSHRGAPPARSPPTPRRRAARPRRCRSRRRTCRPRAAGSSPVPRRSGRSSAPRPPGCRARCRAPPRTRRRAAPRPGWCSGRPAPRPRRCR